MPTFATRLSLEHVQRAPQTERTAPAQRRPGWGRTGWLALLLAALAAPAPALADVPDEAFAGAAEGDEGIEGATSDHSTPAAEGDDEATAVEVTVEAGSLNDDDDTHESDACPRLFGSERLAKRHAARRAQILWGVERVASVVEVEHSAGWDRPHYLEFRGLELMDAMPGAEATFRVTDAIDQPDCEAGDYTIEVDDSLGERGHVLAVLNDVVLVEYQGQLSYLATPEARIPTWRMVWRSPWKLVRRRHTGVSSSTMPSRKNNRYRSNTNRSRSRARARRR